MKKTIDTIKLLRTNLLSITAQLSIEQLNHIPAGFNNNIVWNAGHVIAAQQGICYKRSGLGTITDEGFFERYKPGTRPEGFVSQQEFDEIKTLLVSTIDRLEEDYDRMIFKTYTPFVTRYGVAVDNIEDAIEFIPFHEGFHTGYVLALKKLAG